MKKILVTGATGFIGNHVVTELLSRNYSVIASSSSANKASCFSWFKKVDYVELNLRDRKDNINYFDFFHQPDVMIHLAWEGLPHYNSAHHLGENLPGHLAFLTNLLENGLKDLTVAGTCFEYGLQEGKLSETMETRPVNAYAKAKDELRKKLQQLCDQQAVSFKWARLFYMYGSGQNPASLLPQLEKALAEGRPEFNMSGGEQERDFLPVEKMARYIVAIATQDKLTGIINCCSGKPIKIIEFVKTYLADHGKDIRLNLGYYPYADYEPMRFWGEDSRLRSIIEEDNFTI